MRLLFAALAAVALSGCMCRPGVIDCTTSRAYPGFCKPLCGGPCDPFMWLAGDCSTCCCCSYKCGYTPYGGRTCFGDDMTYTPSCVSPPLRWAPPAQPSAPFGHTVYPPGPPLVPKAPSPLPTYGDAPGAATTANPPVAPPSDPEPAPDTDESYEPPLRSPPADIEPEVRTGPRILHDARNEPLERLRR
jgi:hypothetical protein